MSRLLHYSNTPVATVYSVEQKVGVPRYRHDKPTGLWVSVEGEDDWRTWCESESFGNPSAQVCHEVTLSPGAKILRIATEGALREFSHTFGFERYPRLPEYPDHVNVAGIAWDHLSHCYQGIIIAPYQWECRLDDRVGWYYGWDCASGCIWDASAVATITPHVVEPPRERETVDA